MSATPKLYRIKITFKSGRKATYYVFESGTPVQPGATKWVRYYKGWEVRPDLKRVGTYPVNVSGRQIASFAATEIP